MLCHLLDHTGNIDADGFIVAPRVQRDLVLQALDLLFEEPLLA
jgi:hypothetical protein